MKETSVKKVIHAPAEAVWEVVSDHAGVDRFMPGISSCEVFYQGTTPVRSIMLHDGSNYKEALISIDHQAMKLCYEMLDPIPFSYSHLTGEIMITSLGENECQIDWGCTYEADPGQAEEVSTLLTLLINLSIKGLEKCSRKLMCTA